MHTSTITSKGQVTIPAELRKTLGLMPGNRIAFRLEGDNILLEAVKDDITAAFGMLDADRYVSVEEMDQAAATKAVAAKLGDRTRLAE
jgi:AbrB family looped-hinge helix DNA binding protein